MSKGIDPASPFYQQNGRKILKWVFMLLQEHHERLGLKVVAWSGPEGIGIPRLSFFFQKVRNPEGRPIYHFPIGGETFEMQIYQWEVGVFQPLGNGPQSHPKQSKMELRTKDMVPWFNEQLRITPIYQSIDSKLFPYTEPTVDWKGRVNRYLLSWNVLGLLLRRLPYYVRLESLGFTSVLEQWDGRYNAHSTGNAHGRAAKGNFTLIASVTHLCPQTQTTWRCVDRQAS